MNQPQFLNQTYPNIAIEWHPTKNGDLTPDMFTSNSKMKIYWTCGNDHVWNASISNRTGIGSGCPYCYNKKKYNDNKIKTVSFLQDTHPEIAVYLHATKNNGLSAKDVTAGSKKKLWWSKEGKDFQARISDIVFGRHKSICSKSVS